MQTKNFGAIAVLLHGPIWSSNEFFLHFGTLAFRTTFTSLLYSSVM